MTNYSWFCIKGIFYLVLIGFALWYLNSGWVLLSLLLLPEYHENGDDEKIISKFIKEYH